MYNRTTGRFDYVEFNTGHWGDIVYPGIGKVRAGVDMYMDPARVVTSVA